MNTFAFTLGQPVTLTLSGETGFVVGRAEYSDTAPSYFVRYRAADGRQTEAWWPASALAAAEAAPELPAAQA